MLETVQRINSFVNGFVWGPIMMVIMVGIGVYFTFRLRFFQISKFGHVLKVTFGSIFKKKEKKDGSISSFQAMTTALAATLGTGNIVGVATAIIIGGPGAIFWMWVSAFFGMMTKYAEVTLSIHYKDKNENGESVGGPMYYIEKGLHQKWLAIIFALFCFIASFGIGNMAQINSATKALGEAFHISEYNWVVGILFSIILGLVIIGGIKSIGKITEMVIPLFSIFYILAGIVLLIVHYEAIPEALKSIFTYAFNPPAAASGVLGYTIMQGMRQGIAKGVFSNEAGLGSAPIAYAAAGSNDPAEQGIWGILEVFLDTIIMCTLTALIVLTSGAWQTPGITGAELTIQAFSAGIGDYAGNIVAISTVAFALATCLSWSYYGEKSIEYLTKNNNIVSIYRILYIFVIVVGAVIESDLVWDLSDTFNGLMAIPNIIALILLSPKVIRITREYLQRLKRKKKGKS